MAKGDPNNKGKAFRDSLKPAYEQSEFVRYALDDAEKAECKAWVIQPGQEFDMLLGLVDTGYKVTFRFDDVSHAYACWFLAKKDDPANPNMILSGRGSSPAKAFKQAAFMHWKIFDEVWPKNSAPKSPEDFDD